MTATALVNLSGLLLNAMIAAGSLYLATNRTRWLVRDWQQKSTRPNVGKTAYLGSDPARFWRLILIKLFWILALITLAVAMTYLLIARLILV